MTYIQICALISIVIGVAILYWIAYRNGFSNGRSEGHSWGYSEGYDVGGCEGYREGKAIGRDEMSLEVRLLELRCEAMKRDLAFGPTERTTLRQIAKLLQLAADTFRALKSDHEQQALQLQTHALNMAARLEPAAQENAA